MMGAVYIPFMQDLLGFEPLSLGEIAWIAVISSSVLWIGEIYKLVTKPPQN
jgi:hypothetical protein